MSNINVTDTRLIEAIRICAQDLPPEAHEVATVLRKYADEIETTETGEISLKKFDEFAWHWKGLRDVIVPGVRQKDWEKQVLTMSLCARAAIKLRKAPSWWKRWFM